MGFLPKRGKGNARGTAIRRWQAQPQRGLSPWQRLFCVSNRRGGVCVFRLYYIACSYPALLREIVPVVCGTMLIRLARFNTYLLALLALTLACGCQTAEKKRKKQIATLELHLEARSSGSERTTEAKILRDQPITLTVEQIPFLTESYVKKAKVYDVEGGFAIRIEFDQHGTWVLEASSTQNLGKHIALLSRFGEKLKESRWLAAPIIMHRISDGVLVFTPDASREEADQIVLGLNNVAKKLKKDEKDD